VESKKDIVDELNEIMENLNFNQRSDWRRTLTSSAIILKRTSQLAMAMSPIVLRMTGCQVWKSMMTSRQSFPENTAATSAITPTPPGVHDTRRNIGRN
jgi:hypothetical protein